MQEVQTFCRICEASCGMIAEVEEGKIVNLKPNKDHIGTLGFSCMKGLNQHKMYDSPDRLKYPLKRVGDSFERISWEQALSEIGAKVKALRKVSEQSISMYVGTAAGFSLLHPIFAEGFMQGLGSHNIYASSTQDCANRFAAAEEMYGFPFFQPFVDLDHVNCMLVVGTNPVVSKWTFLQVAHPVKRIKELVKRGGQAIFVDPRYTESAKVGTGHVFIRPNTDLFFFLAFLHEVVRRDNVARDRVDQYMSGLPELEQLVSEWTPERCGEVTGIAAEALRDLVTTFVDADGAAIVTGTGIGMGQNGTLAQWLAEVINAVTGNLDRSGGTLVGRGIFDFPEFSHKNGMFNREKISRIGQFRELNGGFPGGILADEILTPGKDQIKALFVTGGNPLLTMANSERLYQAFQELELMVVTDIYLNETASLADYVLPATSPLQRPDLPFVFPLLLGMQSIPYLAATDAVVEPDGEQRDEASIYTDLATACGAPLFGSRFMQWLLRLLRWTNTTFGARNKQPGLPQRWILNQILKRSGNGSFDELVAEQDGRPVGGAKANDFLGSRPFTPDNKVQLAPERFIEKCQTLPAIYDDLLRQQVEGKFRLITKRAHSTHNSWTQNIDELTNGDANRTNFVYLHPSDAEELGLAAGDAADVTSETATVRLPVKYNKDLMPGCAAIPHGWGHQRALGLSVAGAISGVNVNLLAADGPDKVEDLSGMAQLTGIPVEIRPAAAAVDTSSWSGIASG